MTITPLLEALKQARLLADWRYLHRPEDPHRLNATGVNSLARAAGATRDVFEWSDETDSGGRRHFQMTVNSPPGDANQPVSGWATWGPDRQFALDPDSQDRIRVQLDGWVKWAESLSRESLTLTPKRSSSAMWAEVIQLVGAIRSVAGVKSLLEHRRRVAAGEMVQRDTPEMRQEMRESIGIATTRCNEVVESMRAHGIAPLEASEAEQIVEAIKRALNEYLPLLESWVKDPTLASKPELAKAITNAFDGLEGFASMVDNISRRRAAKGIVVLAGRGAGARLTQEDGGEDAGRWYSAAAIKRSTGITPDRLRMGARRQQWAAQKRRHELFYDVLELAERLPEDADALLEMAGLSKAQRERRRT